MDMVKKINKKSNNREDKTKQRVGNKWLYFMINGLGSFVQELRKEKTYQNIGKKIYLMLKKNKIPLHWGESIAQLVADPETANTPDHEFLSLKIGNHYIQSSSFNKEKIVAMKGQEFSIAINGQVSKTEIKDFLDRHSDLIDEIYQLLDLQKSQYFGDSAFTENFLTTLVKNNPGITYEEVCKFVEGQDGVDTDAPDYSRTRKRIKRSKTLDVL